MIAVAGRGHGLLMTSRDVTASFAVTRISGVPIASTDEPA